MGIKLLTAVLCYPQVAERGACYIQSSREVYVQAGEPGKAVSGIHHEVLNGCQGEIMYHMNLSEAFLSVAGSHAAPLLSISCAVALKHT